MREMLEIWKKADTDGDGFISLTEFGMMERKTGLSVDDISRKVPMTVVTYGEQGSEIRVGGEPLNPMIYIGAGNDVL